MSQFFISRPIFAWVLALALMLFGGISITRLPVAQYPEIAPPSVTINAIYPGASAQAVADSVTQVIEQQMKGLDGLLYMSSTSESNGRAAITLTFQNGTDPDIAQVQVQNKLSLATPLLPQVVQQQGLQVSKVSSGFLMVVGFVSGDDSLDRQDLADLIASRVLDPISRVPGVGTTQLFGSPYAMRIWLDPNALETYGLTPTDVAAAIRAQNQQVVVGQLGGTPAVEGQQLTASITAQDRLQTAEQFEAIILRATPDGAVLRLGDIARVALGAEDYGFISRFNGQPSSGFGISMATGANALRTAEGVQQVLDEVRPTLPPGVEVVVPFETTPFIREAIRGVIETLFEAIALVFLVMFLFLQSWRATLIPTIAIPVVLLGTFGVMAVAGYSVNMLTMFAMVLAIGLLVDDAIVVVENVERVMHEEGLSPVEATRASMRQISGALVGIGLVLSSVFVPMAFIQGSTGVIFRQFSLTIVTAMALSVLVALVLTPALCATLLRPAKPGQQARRGFFGGFNRTFERATERYGRAVGWMARRAGRFMLVFAVLTALMVWLFLRLPTAFLPLEDQGMLFAMVQTPAGATQQRTMQVVEQVEQQFLKDPAVESLFTVQGFSFAGAGQNTAIGFVKLKDWEERDLRTQGVEAVAGGASMAFAGIRDALAFAFPPPAVPELGNATGFDFFLRDSGEQGHEALIAARNQLLGAAMQSPLLQNVRPNGLDDTPQFRVEVDEAQALSLGLSIAEVNETLSIAWGGRYVDDFIDRGRVKRVYVQADAPFRMNPEDFRLWSVRNAEGQMVPFSSFATTRWDYGSPRLERYDGVPATQIVGEPAPGVSSGAAMEEITRIASTLPPGFTVSWTGQSFQEREAGAQVPLLYMLSLMLVFLCLAAMYESWAVPTAVLLLAPLGILGTVLAAGLRGIERDIYFQVAMLATVGLSSKNAILIVAFAKENLEAGMGRIEATLAAVRARLRPILMTSLAFGLGVLPLALASGAGSGAQRSIGTGVLGGMILGTFLGIFFVPLFFVVIEGLLARRRPRQAPVPD
ncbi:MAG TPA: efflux RND transporter permease subunit [Myxococcaceae bacterium]|nr:efflux RND transporter permease subunit [Myxococcaceae bacterium]